MVKYTQVSRLAGASITGTINLSKLQAATLTTFQPANAAGTISASLVMMGYGGVVTVTATKTGKLLIFIFGAVVNGTVGDGAGLIMKYGTGTAPINGAAVSGTNITTVGADGGHFYLLTLGTTGKEPFTYAAYLDNSANLNVATWFDIALNALTGGTSTITNVQFVIVELSN